VGHLQISLQRRLALHSLLMAVSSFECLHNHLTISNFGADLLLSPSCISNSLLSFHIFTLLLILLPDRLPSYPTLSLCRVDGIPHFIMTPRANYWFNFQAKNGQVTEREVAEVYREKEVIDTFTSRLVCDHLF
jgi:hypothetical protein